MMRPINQDLTAVDVTSNENGQVVITLDKDYARQVQAALEVITHEGCDEVHDFSSLYLTLDIVISQMEG